MVGGGCGAWQEINSWQVEIPEPVSLTSQAISPPPTSQGQTVKVLHLTDIHIDLTYTEVTHLASPTVI